MSLLVSLLAGGAVGIRHAFEADHLAAVATLVEENATRPGFVGTSWGIGHSLPVIGLGLAFVLLGIRLPDAATAVVEVVVGVVLIVLGGRLLLTVAGFGPRRHVHDAAANHDHLGVGRVSLGSTHSHVDGRSVAIGALHGVAGSGGLVVLLVATAPTLASAVAFLAGFSLLSILTMGAMSLVWGRALGSAWTTRLEIGAGVVGLAVGAMVLLGAVGHS